MEVLSFDYIIKTENVLTSSAVWKLLDTVRRLFEIVRVEQLHFCNNT